MNLKLQPEEVSSRAETEIVALAFCGPGSELTADLSDIPIAVLCEMSRRYADLESDKKDGSRRFVEPKFPTIQQCRRLTDRWSISRHDDDLLDHPDQDLDPPIGTRLPNLGRGRDRSLWLWLTTNCEDRCHADLRWYTNPHHEEMRSLKTSRPCWLVADIRTESRADSIALKRAVRNGAVVNLEEAARSYAAWNLWMEIHPGQAIDDADPMHPDVIVAELADRIADELNRRQTGYFKPARFDWDTSELAISGFGDHRSG